MLSHSQQLYQNNVQSAKLAGLKYVSDRQPGITRRRWGRGFTYLSPNGKHIKDKAVRQRIQAMVIPPSWKEVWICTNPNGHLQSTGRDPKGRKQYRYHPDWIKLRNQLKFDRLIAFAMALAELRRQVRSRLEWAAQPDAAVDRETVIAALVSLLDKTLIRIGNVEYAQSNQSYGLTTLRDRHLHIESGHINLEFRGKSGIEHSIDLRDPRLAKILKRCKEIPGYTLFQYIDSDGNRAAIDSGDINTYLKTTMGEPFTAKDFRTWGGTVAVCQALRAAADSVDEHPDNSCVTAAIRTAAQQLGNRPATCRKYYVHPRVLDAYRAGWLYEVLKTPIQAQPSPLSASLRQYLSTDEQNVLAVLQADRQLVQMPASQNAPQAA